MDQAIQSLIEKYGLTEKAQQFLNKHQQMYINGEFVDGTEGESLNSYEPSTGTLLASIPVAGESEVDCAVASARQALTTGEWGSLKPNQRQGLIQRLASLVEENAQTIAEIETLDNGKAVTGCREIDVLGGADLLHYMAGWATKIQGATRSISLPGEHLAYTLKEPVGVVAAIVPWNWPFNMAIWKLAAPLAAGCTLVLKPAQQTSLSMLYFAELCEQAGLPKGVVNIVTGRGSRVGNYLASHPGIDKLSFTGSTQVGKVVGKAALDNMTRLTLELGGKSPMIAFEDVDIEQLAKSTLDSVYFNAGQVCSAGSRLYVQRKIYDQVVSAIAKVVTAMRLGTGLDPDTEMGPVISSAAQQSILDYIRIGIEEGARLVCGGKAPADDESLKNGFFVEPTLLADCHNEMRVVQEEIFGPVLCVVPFDDEEEAIAMANDNCYGLAASIWTQDISRAHRLVSKLQAGSVWINGHDLVDSAMPFGGYKQSGFGRDLGPEQLEHFLETKAVTVCINS